MFHTRLLTLCDVDAAAAFRYDALILHASAAMPLLIYAMLYAYAIATPPALLVALCLRLRHAFSPDTPLFLRVGSC